MTEIAMIREQVAAREGWADPDDEQVAIGDGTYAIFHAGGYGVIGWDGEWDVCHASDAYPVEGQRFAALETAMDKAEQLGA